MLIRALALAGITLSLSVNAAIVDLGNITRDTDTGLDWLDVTETRGLSYDQVTAQMGSGGTYEGWRYASMAELDQLIIGFGYVAVDTNCANTALNCDSNIAGDSVIIENIITTLGDVFNDFADDVNDSRDVAPGGAGFTWGILGSSNILNLPGVLFDTSIILDSEFITRATGLFDVDQPDRVVTNFSITGAAGSNPEIGSYLVMSSPSPVPVPAAGWLFLTALAGLVGKKLRMRRL